MGSCKISFRVSNQDAQAAGRRHVAESKTWVIVGLGALESVKYYLCNI